MKKAPLALLFLVLNNQKTQDEAGIIMPLRRGYADGPFGQVHYIECGPGVEAGMPLVLCHQSPTSSIQFIKAIPFLTQAGLHVIALAHPSRVTKLILNGPAPLSPEERQAWMDTAVAREKAWRIKPDGSHMMDLWQRRSDNTPGWQDVHTMNRHVLQCLLAGEYHWYGHNAAFSYDHSAALQKITQPSLILTNTGDGIYDLALRARDMRPDFDFIELDGGTHDIIDEQPEAWAKAVAHYVKS